MTPVSFPNCAAEWIICACVFAVVLPFSVVAALLFVAVMLVFAVVGMACHMALALARFVRHPSAASLPDNVPFTALENRTCERCQEPATHFVRDGIVRLHQERGWVAKKYRTDGPLRAFCDRHARPPVAVFTPPTGSGDAPADRRPDLPD